jgi:hypothetical protein
MSLIQQLFLIRFGVRVVKRFLLLLFPLDHVCFGQRSTLVVVVVRARIGVRLERVQGSGRWHERSVRRTSLVKCAATV